MKKFFSRKFISRFFVFIISAAFLFSCFIFPSSAISSDSLDDVFSDVVLRDSLGSPVGSGIIKGNSVYIDFDFIQDTIYSITVELIPSSDLPATLWQSFNAFFTFEDSFHFQTNYTDSFDVYRGIIGEETFQGVFSYDEWGYSCDFDFPSKKLPTTYSYCFSFAAFCSSSSDMVLKFSNVDLNFLTDDEKAVYDSTNRIIANQDKNTDKILNGGHDSPSYESPDTSIYNDYKSKEESLNSSAQSGLEDTTDFFNQFIPSFDYSTLWYGLNGVTRIMKLFLNNWFIRSIVQFSLSIGAFAFIVGLASFVISRFSGSDHREKF